MKNYVMLDFRELVQEKVWYILNSGIFGVTCYLSKRRNALAQDAAFFVRIVNFQSGKW